MNQSFLCRLSHFSTDWQLLCCCQEADCSGSAPALCAAEPLGQWSLLPPCVCCVAPPAMLWSHPLPVPEIHCGPLFVFRFLTPLSSAEEKKKQQHLSSATQQNGSDSGMFRLKIRQGIFGLNLCTGRSYSYALVQGMCPQSAAMELLSGLEYCRMQCVRLWFH